MLKSFNQSTTTRNYAVSFYKTLEEVPWHQWLKKLKKWQTFSKSLKIVKGGCTGGLMGRGGQQRGGGGWGQ